MSAILPIAQDALTPFAKQKNTGNCYEFYTALYFLRQMGLTDDDCIILGPLIVEISNTNAKSSAKIMSTFKNMCAKPVGKGLVINNVSVISLRNVTQSDDDGGTGDLILVFANGTEKSVSVCEGQRKKNGDIEKCLSNPTCRRFGCDDDTVTQFKNIANDAVPKYKAEIAAKYGPDETKWPQSRFKSKAQPEACSTVASIVCTKFNALAKGLKVAIMEDLLRISAGTKPADMLCIVKNDCSSHSLYEIRGVKPDLVWSPRFETANYYLNMYLGDIQIGRTQVKFNNGVYHKGKTSSLTSSWNATAIMSKVFDLTPCL